MTTRVVVLALTVLFLGDGSVRSQETLAEAAAREKARRAEQKAKKGKKYTDEDLKKLGAKSATKAGAAAPAPQSSPATSASTEGPAVDESSREFWRPRVEGARAEVARREAAVKDLEVRIKELRDSVSHPVRLNEANRDGAIARDTLELQRQLEVAQQSLEEAKQAVEAVLEQARRAGVPASQLD